MSDNKPVHQQQQEALPNQDVSSVRSRYAKHEQPKHQFSDSDIDDIVQSRAEAQALEAREQARIEAENGQSQAIRLSGHQAVNDFTARVIARYDRNDRRVQPAEFYSFVSPALRKYGRF